MKSVLSVLLFAGLAASKPQETYDTRYDNIDLDNILRNDRLYKSYLNCIINEGKCTEDAKELKDSLPEALKNDCKKCSEKQKLGGDKVMEFVIQNKPDDYKKIAKIYDPEGVYKKKYNEQAKKLGRKLIE